MSSKAAVRQRGAGFPPAGRSTRPGEAYSHKDDKRRPPTPGSALLPDTFVLLYLLLVTLLIAVALHSYWKLPDPIYHGEPNEFIAGNARKHLEEISSLGIRHVGNPANEIHAKNMIVRKVEEIRAVASREVEIEISLQYPSGHYYLDFLGGMTHLYHNVTNIAVRFSRRGTSPVHAFLINAHFDSALGSVAASDDIVSCATMLEVLRGLSVDPHPLLAEHALIFLFNGAEETILQASHGFITQHPWAGQIRAFLNLEAAGAGGKEIVFQTGPQHPWLVRAYTDAVPHPFATVLAQEVFQSGIIPSDTDFRIFRDYGHIPGIDVAYFVNGYIYHTEYDVPSRIPDSCIQRAGENVLALLKEIANSPFLADPGADKHGKVVFFDILGLTAVTFPERIASIFNILVALAVIASIYFGVSGQGETGQKNQDKPSLTMVLLTLGTLLLSWIAALAIAVATALLLGQCGCLMTWFTHNIIILPLYGVPSFLAMAAVHTYWRYKNPKISQKALEKSCFNAVQLLWTILVIVFTYLRVCSTFIFSVWAVFPLVFRVLLWDTLLQKNLDQKQQPALYHTLLVVLSVLSLSLPFMWGSLLAVGLFDMFIPLMGRSGSLFSPDIAIGILTAGIVCFQATSMLSVVVYASSLKLKKWIGSLLLLVYIVALVLALSGSVFPFSGGEQPRSKRFFLQHTDRTFYNVDGTVRRADSRVFLNSFDFLGIDVIANEVPMLKKAMVSECDGVYCGEPFYIPVRHVIRTSWYLPAPKLEVKEPLSLKLLSMERSSSGLTNFTFQTKFPTRVTMFISPRKGYSMTAWSLEKFVPPFTPCVSEHECYFVFYARGQGDGEHTFWVELKGDSETTGESLEIAIATHHIDPPESQTEFLSELLQSLPEWVTALAWTNTYTSWVF